jgi:DNA-binding NarL/FixJ family response regulator
MNKIRVAILDDHQSIVDGYSYRLAGNPLVEISGTLSFGCELEAFLEKVPADVLILDVNVPTAPDNPNPYPILHLIPRLLTRLPEMAILIISMHNQRTLIQAMVEAGISGYIVKDDRESIQQLGAIIQSIAGGGVFFSQQAHQQLRGKHPGNTDPALPLTPRQLEALSLCAAYPGCTTLELARKLGVENSTVRNLLSGAYIRLNVSNRSAAIAKARHAGLIAPEISAPTIDN